MEDLRIDLTGQKFGRWTVKERAENKGVKTCWSCICDCGTVRDVRTCSLKSGDSLSCGCLNKEMTKKMLEDRNYKHGLSNHPLNDVFYSMRSRCLSEENKSYKNYGGRGIAICDEWRSDFKTFYDWCIENGYKEGLQIDRIDNNGNYEPSNCRFITNRKNSLNRRMYKSNKSGYVGVVWDKKSNKWSSRITINQKRISFGFFSDKQHAIEARNNYIIENYLENEYKIQ